MVFKARSLSMWYLGSILAAASALSLLQRRCDSRALLLSGECPLPSPGLSAEVNGAIALLLRRGSLQTCLHRPYIHGLA